MIMLGMYQYEHNLGKISLYGKLNACLIVCFTARLTSLIFQQ